MAPPMRERHLSLVSAVIVLLLGSAVGWASGGSPPVLLVLFLSGIAAVAAVALTDSGGDGDALAHAAPPPPPVLPLYRQPGFDALIDALPFPVLLVDSELVLAGNHPARRLLGDFIIGADVRSAIRHPAAVDRLTRFAQRPHDAPVQLVGLGSATQRWEMRTAAIGDGVLLVTLTDESARDAVDRMRADFVANASHELRTPLAAVLGYVETLQDDAAGADAALRRRFLGTISTQARRMQQLVGDLLSMSRLETTRHIAPTEIVRLDALIRSVIGEAQAAGDERVRDIAAALPDAPQPVRGDAAQLAQMLHNVIGNALKYGRAGTPVEVALRRTESAMIELTVSDQGDGIAPDHLPRLTERFYRVDSARSRELGGTGLGLAIVRHVVERHRGQFDIASEVGKGTTVTIRLPASD